MLTTLDIMQQMKQNICILLFIKQFAILKKMNAMSVMKVEMILKIMMSINIYHWRVPKNKKKYEIRLNMFLNRTMMMMQIMGKITI